MSHVTTINLEIKDMECFREACADLGYGFEVNTSVQLYQQSACYTDATKVTIPGWKYPLAVKDGKIYYDNYNGSWGTIDKLHALKQRYARNVAVKQAKRKGFRVTEKVENGTVKLRLSR